MSKQKRKLKKNQVQVDGNVYNVGSSTYNQMYENKFENGDVVWDSLLEEWVSVPRGMIDAWDELYKNQRVGKAQNKVRKGTGSVARPLLDAGLEITGGAGAYRFAQDPIKNLQGTANVLSYANLPGLAMHGLDYMQGKPFFNVTSEDLEGLGNTFDVAGLATLGTAPLIKQGLKVAPKLLNKTSKINPNVGMNFVDKSLNTSKITQSKSAAPSTKINTQQPAIDNPSKSLPSTSSSGSVKNELKKSKPITELEIERYYKPFLKDDFDTDLLVSKIYDYQKKNPNLSEKEIQYLVLRDSDILNMSNKSTNINLNTKYVDAVESLKTKKINLPTEEYLKKRGLNPNESTLRELFNVIGTVPNQQLNTQFTPAELLSIDRYAKGFDDIMNAGLRFGKQRSADRGKISRFSPNFNSYSESPQLVQKAITEDSDILVNAIQQNKFVEETPLYRRVSPFKVKVKQADGTVVEKMYPTDLIEGDEFLEKGFMSTTTHENDGFDIVVNAPGNNKQSFLYLNSVPESSQFINESEALLPPGLKLKHSGKYKDSKPIFDISNPYMQTGVVGTGAIGTGLMSQEGIAPEQKAYGGKINNMKKNKLPKYQTGGPVDPILSNRLMQYLFGRNTNKPSILDARSLNEYGVSFGDRFNIQSGLSFDPMTGMPSGYGKVGINNKGFNLGLEKRKGQSNFNVGYDSPNFNINATYSNTDKMPSIGGNVGFNTKGFNVGASGNYSPDNKNIGANIGYNNNGFNAGLNYDYSGQSSLSGNVGYGNDLFNAGLSGSYSPGDANVNLNTTYNLGTRRKQKAEPIPLAFNTPEEIQMIKEDIDTNSNEAVGPSKKSYSGKITNMKKKKSNNLPKYFNGTPGVGTPGTQGSLFNILGGLQQLGNTQNPTLGNQNPNFQQMPNQNLSNMNVTGKGMSNALQGATGPLGGVMKMLNGPLAPLAGMAMSSVTDMVHAINTPERERRPVLQNAASYTFDNGGTVGGKSKYVKVNGKRMKIDSPEYREYYQQVMNDREQGIFYNSPIDAEVVVMGKKMTKKEKKEAQENREKQLALMQNYENTQVDPYSPEYFEKASKVKPPARTKKPNSIFENLLEFFPAIGQVASMDDAYKAVQDMYNGQNQQGTFNNVIDMLGVLPMGKFGNLFKIPKYLEKAADAATMYGGGKDVYQDNIAPMLGPESKQSLPPNTNFVKDEEYAVGGVVRPEKGYTLMPNNEMQFANIPAAFDYANGGLVGNYMDAFDAMGYGGMIDPSMAMQQMMYGSYAQGGQVPQNIPVEVEGEEMYEMPNGQTGEFSGPKHENGGMPVSLPEGTKIYSDRLKVNSKTMAARKDKREANIAKLEKLLTKNPNDKFVKEAIKRQQETNALQEQGDMQQQEMANQQQAQKEMAMEEMMMGAAQQQIQEGMMMAMGGMIKRADGSYSQRGLWDNIRANAGSGKKPTKQMLAQEKKIKRAEKAYGGMVEYAYGGNLNKYAYGGEPCEPGFVKDASGNCVPAPREVSGVDINRAFRKGGSGKVDPPGVNPYDAMNSVLGNTFQNIAQSKDPYINTKGGMMPNPLYNEVIGNKMLKEEDPKKPNRFMNFLNNAANETGDFLTGLFDRNGNPKRNTNINPNATPNTNSNYDLTEGDRTGMLGTSVGMYGPAMMTMLNRMETPSNTNYFSTFGQDALRTQEEAEGLAGISKDEAYRKNIMRANALRKQLSNTARGVNDIRSGQLTAELAEQEGARGILTNYLQGMSQLKGQRAGLQQQIDQTRMGGEQQRDLADRQDIDQYYTNLAENVANASNMMQKQGRDLNVVQYNKDIMNLSKAYSKYGVYAVRDPKSGLLTLAHKDTNGKITYLSENEVEELANQQPKVTTTPVKKPE